VALKVGAEVDWQFDISRRERGCTVFEGRALYLPENEALTVSIIVGENYASFEASPFGEPSYLLVLDLSWVHGPPSSGPLERLARIADGSEGPSLFA
jgi:hypothetical protein